MPKSKAPSRFKYNEEKALAEIKEYVASTYGAHYTSKSGVQVLDLLFSTDIGRPYCVGNAIKYLSRLGRKGQNTERQDILKTIHYCILILHLLDIEKET